MSSAPSDLPQYKHPPVVETVLGVHFQPLDKVSIVDQSLFWSKLANEYPQVEERQSVDEVREPFGDELWNASHSVRWEVGGSPPLRLWAKSSDGQHTIQIQKDALLTNWERNLEKADKYLSYEERRDQFKEKLSAFRDFLIEQEKGELKPRSCMVRYINHIPLEDTANLASTIEAMFTCWKNETSDGWLPLSDTLNLQFGIPMPDESGRLRVQIVQAVRRTDKQRMIRFDLTARGRVAETTISSAMSWLDVGHEWIVRAFTSLTTPEMHEKWGRKQ